MARCLPHYGLVLLLSGCGECHDMEQGEAAAFVSDLTPESDDGLEDDRPSFVFEDGRSVAAHAVANPIRLTASDGTGLTLVRLSAEAVVDAAIASTALNLTFVNPEKRTREGRFEIELPPGARVSGFAMKIGKTWQRGAVVERQRARVVYEDFLHRKQDPALLEHQPGNVFTARVFPIPPRATKELIVEFEQEITGGVYRLPLRGLPMLKKLEATVTVGERVHRHVDQNLTPADDFLVPIPTERVGLRNDNLVMSKVRPSVARIPTTVDGWLVLVDTSASRALQFSRQARVVRRLVDGYRRARADAPLVVAAFDQEVEVVFDGRAHGFDDEAFERLVDRRALGATDLAGALRAVLPRVMMGDLSRVLVVTDGVRTAGDDVAKAARALGEHHAARIDALVVGGMREASTLDALVSAGLPEDGVVLDGDSSLDEIALALTSRVQTVEVEVDHATWVWPKTIRGHLFDRDVVVFADVSPTQDTALRINGERHSTVYRAPRDASKLMRAWSAARIRRLTERRDASDEPDVREALKNEIVRLSTAHQISTPYTAWIVLETEADFRRFGITRAGDRLRTARTNNALGGLHGTSIGDASGVGGLGMRGHGEGGGGSPLGIGGLGTMGSGYGRGRRGLGSSPRTSVRLGAPIVRGSMAREQVRRVFRRRLATFRYCYEREFVRRPELRGRVTVEVEVDATGRVRRAEILRSTLDSREVEQCITGQARRMRFPTSKGGGTLIVRYPLNFEPTDATTKKAPRASSNPANYLDGRMLEVRRMLDRDNAMQALSVAKTWREEAPGDVLALLALGDAFAALSDMDNAARAFGSLIDLYPMRADLRRHAGQRLLALDDEAALHLAIDDFERAKDDRPDHPSGHRLLAWAQLAADDSASAFDTIVAGAMRTYPSGRFAGVDRVLEEDVALIGRALCSKDSSKCDAVDRALESLNASPADQPSTRFIMYWESDANDVDLHVYDRRGDHAYYQSPNLGSGGRLYADVTTGYGPECFTIPHGATAYPYTVDAHYYRKGPMGYGMGMTQVLEHDGNGHFKMKSFPFLVMKDNAFVPVARLEGPLR